ncbi:PREDICTED: DENN domain-containing protein 1B-like, partial [Eurypyga helias]
MAAADMETPSSWENPERTFDLVLKVKCQASENE